MKHKVYFYYFIFHNNFLMRGNPILMMKKLSLWFSNLLEVTQGGLAAVPLFRVFSVVYLPLGPHSKRLEMKGLGQFPAKNCPQVFFLPKEKSSFGSDRAGMLLSITLKGEK